MTRELMKAITEYESTIELSFGKLQISPSLSLSLSLSLPLSLAQLLSLNQRVMQTTSTAEHFAK